MSDCPGDHFWGGRCHFDGSHRNRRPGRDHGSDQACRGKQYCHSTHIAYQFILEAILISFTGGIIGVIIGIAIAYTISTIAEIPTIINIYSILLSFGVAVSVGIIFGYAPARRAAAQDPIMSLRYE
ncbi:MAG: ABC transporter permease [Cyclobacteriaceae bacterium]|nr:ABC transporter permease [Cyclobacteriaceae bacterium]